MVVDTWPTPHGLVEAYAYPPGRAGRDAVHVHDTVQVCLSWDFPGRYRSGRFSAEVPAGAVSVVDAWEPHAAEDPVDRATASHYLVVYVPKARWDAIAESLGCHPRVGITIRRNTALAREVVRLGSSDSRADSLASDEALNRVISTLVRRRSRHRIRPSPREHRLENAREFIRANASGGVSLAEAASHAGLSPQHFSACFRTRYGVPPHRFQTFMRLDRARALLATGMPAAEVATECGFSDQSHLIRQFKRHLGGAPSQYRKRGAERFSWL